MAILHGARTGRNEAAWEATFPERFALDGRDGEAAVAEALAEFSPDVIYVHKMPDLSALQALLVSGWSLVRMVHDHDISRQSSYVPIRNHPHTKSAPNAL